MEGGGAVVVGIEERNDKERSDTERSDGMIKRNMRSASERSDGMIKRNMRSASERSHGMVKCNMRSASSLRSSLKSRAFTGSRCYASILPYATSLSQFSILSSSWSALTYSPSEWGAMAPAIVV